MNLTLVIDTAAKPFNVALGRAGECLFDSLFEPEVQDSTDLSAIVSAALSKSSQSLKDVRTIAVNIGPGALGSVRSGVSFANALAYSLGVTLYTVTSFELMGFVASKKHRCPILCSARASSGFAYVGVYRAGETSLMGFGLLAKLAPAAINGIEQVAVAGDHKSLLCNILGSDRAIDSGIARSGAATFFELEHAFDGDAKVFPAVATPLTEDSESFVDLTMVCR